MFDKYNKSEFSNDIFANPPSEFRGAPFWAWNSKLVPEVLREQIDVFKEMGFGGFNMHVRQGLETEYLGDEFFDGVKACIDQADKNGMYAWLYDEDRWPSGAAGGLLTKTKKYRVKVLSLRHERIEEAVSDYHDAIEKVPPVFVAAFSLDLTEDGRLKSYRRVGEDEECENKIYFYCITARGREPRYNFQTYADLLSKEAMDEFKRITYEKYKEEVGDSFGKTVPAIFTDEPQTICPIMLKNAFSTEEAKVAWTWDFPETFKERYGFDIVEKLPEIFYKKYDESDLSAKYFYHRHLSDRFYDAFIDNLGKWCGENGIMFTGHLMEEDNLMGITKRCFDPMRMYSSMQLPGIDVLFDERLFTTAKQCDSVVRQMGKAAILSEMYGVTNWDYDFRGHKSQGDWQACLGVNVRVPHLAWQTMKGEGKRDYPASIFYQSPWYKEYKIVEDHFSRVHTALTRGKAVANVAVLHPMESYAIKLASEAESLDECRGLDAQFKELCNWLLLGSVNFDYIAESLLEELCKNPTCPFKVGQMEYDTIILDNCTNLRPYTINALKSFAKAGGKLIISGLKPKMSLAKLSDEAEELVNIASAVIGHSKHEILSAVSESRTVTIRHNGGALTDDLLYTQRREGNTDWLFVCNAFKPELLHNPSKKSIEIKVNGLFRPTLYNTEDGSISKIPFKTKNGATYVYADMFDFDSLLIRLDRIDADESYLPEQKKLEKTEIKIPSVNSFRLSEPNVLLLDMAQWHLKGEAFREREEIMRIDELARKQLSLPLRRTKCVQPYAVAEVPEVDELYLRFKFTSEIGYEGAKLALENLCNSNIVFNGKKVDNTAVGYFVDKEIKTCELPAIVKGENVLEISMPFGVRTDLENCFILGNFGTGYLGKEVFIKELPDTLAFGDVVHQGLAFYGANITYESQLQLDEDSALEIEISYYRGALVKVEIDGEEIGYIWKSPFRLGTDVIKAGEHRVSYTVYGNRYNTFAALHTLLADKYRVYTGPDYWRSSGFAWSYEYNNKPMGILKTPVINKVKEI